MLSFGIAALVGFAHAQSLTFTGNVETDFVESRPGVVVVPDPGELDVRRERCVVCKLCI